MAKDLDVEVGQLLRRDDLRRRIDLTRYTSDEVGLPTLEDILSELSKPGRDPREEFSAFAFAEGIEKMEDLKPGMKLPGVITNITAFGAFVDIGVHQDGLIHISQLADRYVKDPNEVVKVQEQVEVRVTEVDLERKRIALSMRREQSDEEKVASTGPSDCIKKHDKKSRQNSPQQTTKPDKNRGKNNTQLRQAAPLSNSAFADALRQAGLNKK